MAKDKKNFVEDEQSKEPQFSEIKETIIDENIPEEGKEKKKKKFRDLFKSKEDDEEDKEPIEFTEETINPIDEESRFSNTSDIKKSEVLERLGKKSRSIKEANSILEDIKDEEDISDKSQENIEGIKKKAAEALRLADDETIELKVIRKIAADDEKRKKYFSFLKFKKKNTPVQPKLDLSKATRYEVDVETGLNDEQIKERFQNNYTNVDRNNHSKSIGRIFVDNIFTFFNVLLTIIAIALIIVGSYTDLFFMVIAILNTGIGIFQEIRAKLTMDKLRLVTAPTASVVRNGNTETIPTEQLVLDDIVLLSIGNQVPSDSIVQKGTIEVNESLLTGESLPIKKGPGDLIYAGSFVVSGSCAAKVEKIGDANYSSSIQNVAKQYSKPKSELVKALNRIIHVISIVIIPLGIISFYLNFTNAGNINPNIDLFDKISDAIGKTAGSLICMIPAGMYLLTSFALMSGVLRITKRNTVVRELYSIEMLARVNVLCLDKTGTLTDGTMNVQEVVILKKNYDIKKVMGSYLSAFEDNNQTSIALQQAFRYNNDYHVIDSIPFSSVRKYSAASFENMGTFIMGAPEFIYRQDNPELSKLIAEKQSHGLRVVMLAHTNAMIKNQKINGVVAPIALFVLMDHIRDEAPETIKWFVENGVDIKIISGDSPLTASEIADNCGVPNAKNWISLDGLSINEVQEVANKYTVFGRVSPEQKAALVKAFKSSQKIVGMTGDGVNDIIAMKTSDCSIAMASGADAAKNVANLVLLDSNFASMPKVVEEGRRVINNIQRSSSMFLMKTLFTIFLTLFVIFSNIFGSKMSYPFTPKHLMIMETFCIGIPSAILALQPNKSQIKGHFLRNVICSSLPGSCLLLLSLLCTLFPGRLGFFEINGNIDSQLSIISMAVIGMVICSLSMLYQISRPMDAYRTVLLIFMIICSVLTVFLAPQNLIGINPFILNKIQWLVLGIILFASIPVSSGLTYIFNRFKQNN